VDDRDLTAEMRAVDSREPFEAPETFHGRDIHPDARVSPDAQIDERGVKIGPFTVVYAGVEIGAGTVIDSHCVIGRPVAGNDSRLVLGENSLVRSHSVFYQGSSFGPGLRTGHNVTVREGISAGTALQIGTSCDFQGYTEIGDYVRTHSGVFVAHESKIGDFVWLFPRVVLTSDPHPPSDGNLAGVVVEDYAAIAAMATVLPGVRVGTRSLVASHALVNRDVEPDTIVAGVPAKLLGSTLDVQLRDGSGPAYPWMRHFHRGYPDAVVEQWKLRYPS
jgi:acyl-[acyl carrier protein]--UDP-N-acetylglucosamine O-acyltransferase